MALKTFDPVGFDGLSHVIKIVDEDNVMFYKRFVLDYKIDQLLKCSTGRDLATGIDVQTDFKFEVFRQFSSHGSRIIYLRLDTGIVETFSFNEGVTDFTKVTFDGKTLTCLGGKSDQCQRLKLSDSLSAVPVVILEVKFKPRDGGFNPGTLENWQNNRYSVSGSFYNAFCNADGVQHLRGLNTANNH